MELRKYQIDQLNFLRRKTGSVCKGLQSPTGTGKSFVLLSYIKECIDNNEYGTIVLSTGFNELVFQIAEDARLFGLEPKVLVGSAHLIPNCMRNFYPDFKFSKNPLNVCSNCPKERRDKNKKICSKTCINEYLRQKTYNKSKFQDGTIDMGGFTFTVKSDNSKTKFIITNHSYFIVQKDRLNADLVIFDEAQTYGDFLMSANTISLDEKDKKILEQICENGRPASFVLKNALENGFTVAPKLLEQVRSDVLSAGDMDFDIDMFIYKLERIFAAPSFSSFLEKEGKNFIRTNFFSEYDVSSNGKNPAVIIASATLDEYTKTMFNCKNRNQVYEQREYVQRYKGSYIISSYLEYRDALIPTLEYMPQIYPNCNSGLILCTSNINVKWTVDELSKIGGYQIFTDIKSFKECHEKKILVGSKKFFQGVNIPELDFVMMDKIPFEKYDDKFKAYSFYIQSKTGMDAWKEYSMPKMMNALLQGCGRLWRKNDIENNIYDQGVFVIFDPRLEKKFNYIEKALVRMKPGIKLINSNMIADTLAEKTGLEESETELSESKMELSESKAELVESKVGLNK